MGVLFGTLIGVLPGLGPIATVSLLLPMTYRMSPTAGIIMLAGILYGAQYGGSTTSILLNIPGEATSVVTCIDGYQMAKQGRAGPALGIAAFASFISGTLGIFGMILVSPPLVRLASEFGPPEYFCLTLLGVLMLIYLSKSSLIKAFMMAAFGFLLSTIGQEVFTGTLRFTLNIYELYDGVGLGPVAMGLFGISEVLINLETLWMSRDTVTKKVTGLLPSLKDWADSIWAIVRGSIIGFVLGALPGGGLVLSTFASYTIEKKLSKHPEKFGNGAIEGVAGPESANNAAVQAAFIPFLTLGIPPNASLAIMMGALMIHNVMPGPLLMVEHPDLFWGVVSSMYIGNVMLLVLNLPLIGMWIRVLRVPYVILFPVILLICLIGAYSIGGKVMDMVILIVFGLIGYLLKKLNFEIAPIVLSLILGGIMEPALRRSLLMSSGSFTIFFTRPISLILVMGVIFLLASPVVLKVIRKYRRGLALGG